MENDPYRAEAGPELDAVIHARLMKQTVPAGSCPAYSSDDQLAKQVLSRENESRETIGALFKPPIPNTHGSGVRRSRNRVLPVADAASLFAVIAHEHLIRDEPLEVSVCSGVS
jgi:hypothetical protein